MNDNRNFSWVGSCVVPSTVAALCWVGFAQAAAAAQSAEPAVLEEVVITATKRSSPLKDVPVAVSAITATEIQERGFTQYADYLNSVPGVFFQDAGPGVSQIRMRGISASEGGVPSTVATYFGETVTSVLANHGGKPNLRLVDIDRVEVLRGPQGTLFGANALIGVVRIIPYAPDLQEFSAKIGTRGFTTSRSSDASYHAEGAVNIPLVQDRLAIRLVAYKDDIAGYIDNVFPGREAVDYGGALGLPDGFLVTPAIAPFTHRDINTEDTWGGRASVAWHPTDRLKVDLNYAVQDSTLDSEPFVSPAVGDYQQSRGLDVFAKGKYGERLTLTNVNVGYDWEGVSLTSATSWTKLQRFDDQDITFLAESAFGAPIPWILEDRSHGRLFTEEVRLQSSGEARVQWLLGAFYMKQNADFSQFVADFSCPTCLPQVLAGQDFALDYPDSRFFNQEQRSLFGEASYEFVDRWTLGAGVRYLEDTIESINGAAEGILVGGATEESRAEGTNHEVNPSAYLRFKATDTTTAYLQAARGFRSGQVNQRLPDQCLQQSQEVGTQTISDPDTLWNYEVGLKTRLANGRIGINTAVYKQNWKGVQLGLVLDCGFGVILNGGDVSGKGAEIEFDAQLTNAWRANVSASYTHNEFDSVVAGTGYVEGERVPDAAEKNASAGLQYDFPLGTQWTGFARGDVIYLGSVRYKFSTGPFDQDAFTTGNLRLGFRKNVLAVEFYARNISDKRAVVNTLDPASGAGDILARPRELGVELRYSFE